MSVHEMAALLGVCDRTVKRDRQTIRRDNAVDPGEDLGDEMVAELLNTAEVAMSRLYKAVRPTPDGPNVTAHMQMRAAINSFRIFRDLVRTLADLQYIPSGARRVNLDALSKPDPVMERILRGLPRQ